MSGRMQWAFLVFLSVLAVPIAAFAQGTITGGVRDTSGAILPGVTVEASSEALIERVRSVVTDGNGQYRIVDLRPGTYTVVFTLPGFGTVKREGIQLTGSFVATVDAELRVGSFEETIVVSGESPVVDVQSVTQQQVLGKEVLDSVPTGRSHTTAAILIPGMTGIRDVGGTGSLRTQGAMAIHGGASGDSRVSIDGTSIQNSELTGSLSNHMSDMGGTQEITIDTAGGMAEQPFAGVRINIVPREGGNTFSGSFFGTYANGSFEADNYTDELRSRGLRAPNSLKRVYDFNPSFGGPILKDKLWFFGGARWVENNTYVAGRFYNRNAGNPNVWAYDPDTSNQAFDRTYQRAANVRLTWQASTRNKFNAYYDNQSRCWCNYSGGFAVPPSPEAMSRLEWPANRLATGGWTSPLTNRLLIEVRGSDRKEIYDLVDKQPDGSTNFPLIQVVEQSTGIAYRAMGGVYSTQQPFKLTGARIWQATTNVSYVTGSHAFKLGLGNSWVHRETDVPFKGPNTLVSYRFNVGVPNQISQFAVPYAHSQRQRAELGLYAQDRWTLDRLTLNVGLRYDWYSSYYPEQTLGPGPLVPNRSLTFPETEGLNFRDITPRIGLAYDLFGNGKTALKMNVGRYVTALGIGGGALGEDAAPAVRLANTITRSWNDRGGLGVDRDFVPQCDLTNPLANGECGVMSNANFGSPLPSTSLDPDVTSGWSKRAYQWEFSAGVQQQLAPRVSASFGYFRRIFGNFLVTDNLAVAPSDYSPFSITAPADSRLPDGGGYLIDGLYNLNQNRVGQVNNLLRPASDFGKRISHWNGVDLTVDVRLPQRITLQGGLSTGRTSTDDCDVLSKVDSPSTRFCHVDTKFLAQVKMLGTYVVPRVDVQLAATFQSMPGPQISANYNAPNALVQPSLGRPLSGGAANVTVNLVEPGTMYGERSNQLDVRVGRAFRLGAVRTTLNLDLFNALNTDAVLAYNNNYAAWLVPTSILGARLVKLSAQLDF